MLDVKRHALVVEMMELGRGLAALLAWFSGKFSSFKAVVNELSDDGSAS
jgi:hypothetical protein